MFFFSYNQAMEKKSYSKFCCGDGVKLSGFSSVVKVCRLASISRAKLYVDFEDRRYKSNFYDALRRALDKKHIIERAIMEAAINEMKGSEGK